MIVVNSSENTISTCSSRWTVKFHAHASQLDPNHVL